MEMNAATNILEIAKAVGALATPIVVAGVAYVFKRRQRLFEAGMSKRIKRIGNMSPLINKIYSYLQRVGDLLDCSPKEVLDAKREADREFWTFEYLWSSPFKGAYHAFMHESFDMFTGEGNKTRIHAESPYYPKQEPTPGWIPFTEKPVDKSQNKDIYDALLAAIARDLFFRD